jgi:hypothetical protein
MEKTKTAVYVGIAVLVVVVAILGVTIYANKDKFKSSTEEEKAAA